MCGIVALYASGPVNQRLYDALLLLQHRGQDAAGICTVEGRHFHMHKGMGLVRDVLELAICETCSVTAVLDKYVILLRKCNGCG